MDSQIKLKAPGIRSLIAKVVEYRFLLIMTTLFFTGVLLIIVADAETHFGEVIRDIGIGLLVAGTVGLGVDFLVRREIESEFRALVDESIGELTEPRFGETMEKIGELRDLHAGVSTGINEVRDLLWNNNLRTMGVRQVYPDRAQADFVRWLAGAQPGSTVRLMALCLNPMTTHANERLIRSKLQAGCKIRLLLLDPYSPLVDQRAREEEPRTEEAFKLRVRKWAAFHQDFAQSLEADLAGGFELGFYHAAPTCFIADNQISMLVGFYLHGCRGDDCPHFELEIKPGGTYESFRAHFESLWSQRLPWPERRKEDRSVDKDRRGLYAVQEPGRGAQVL